MAQISEIGWYKSVLRLAGVRTFASNIEANPSFQILKRALEMIAQKHGGTLVDQVIDFSGQRTKCDLAVSTPEFSRGVGIRVDRNTGSVTFLYDQYGGYEQVARNITEEITQNYVAIALIRAMKSLGYKVEEEISKEREGVVLVGRI